MLEEKLCSGLDTAKIEQAAKEAMRRARIVSGVDDIHRDIAKAITAQLRSMTSRNPNNSSAFRL